MTPTRNRPGSLNVSILGQKGARYTFGVVRRESEPDPFSMFLPPEYASVNCCPCDLDQPFCDSNDPCEPNLVFCLGWAYWPQGVSPSVSGAKVVGSTLTFSPNISVTNPSLSSAQYIDAMATFSWNFGDGSPLSTQRNPSHIFATGQTHTVSVTVSSDAVCDIDHDVSKSFTVDIACNSQTYTYNKGRFIGHSEYAANYSNGKQDFGSRKRMFQSPILKTQDVEDVFTVVIQPSPTEFANFIAAANSSWRTPYLDSCGIEYQHYLNIIGIYEIDNNASSSNITLAMHDFAAHGGQNANNFGSTTTGGARIWLDVDDGFRPGVPGHEFGHTLGFIGDFTCETNNFMCGTYPPGPMNGDLIRVLWDKY